MLPKRICVIGAGPAGLAATKSCLDNQLVPVCYELCSGLGGTWNNKERIRMKLSPKVYESLITNLSKEASAFSDFPMPKEWPPYQEWRQYLRYFELYADKFDLKRYIEFDVAVLEVHKSLSYSQTGSWIVRIKSLINGNEKEIEFDAVIVASGGKTKQKWPEYSGLKDRFRGKVLHSGNYESAEEFKGKAVLICGAGNSGCDIAVNCSSVASNVLLSTRSGFWVVPRVFTNGNPLSFGLASRFSIIVRSFLPSWIVKNLVTSLVEARLNHKTLGIKSKYSPTDTRSTFTINDELTLKTYSGQVKIRPEVKSFGEDHVTFVDGRVETVDAVVIATGFTPKLEFLSEDILSNNPEDMRLHKWIFPFNLEHPSTLTFVGSCLPSGGGASNVIVELQARYVTQVLSGKHKLPSVEDMREEWTTRREAMFKQLGCFRFRVPLFKYQEEIANEIGVLPSFLRLLFTDPRLAFNFYFGPLLPYHYRLVGKNSKQECRQYALEARQKTWAFFHL